MLPTTSMRLCGRPAVGSRQVFVTMSLFAKDDSA